MRGLADRGPRVGDFHGPRTAAYIYIYMYIYMYMLFFFGKNDVPGIFMPCVCVMHCRRRFFFRKNDVPVIFMPCVFLESCIFIDFHRFTWISMVFHGFERFWEQNV